MNDTQKGSWSMLVLALFTMVVLGYMAFGVFNNGALPEGKWALPSLFVFMFLQFFFIRKKHGSKEVEKDERDIIVMRNAGTVSFFSLVGLLLAAGVVPMYVYSDEGSMPLVVIPFAIISLVSISFVIFHVVVLVQYRDN